MDEAVSQCQGAARMSQALTFCNQAEPLKVATTGYIVCSFSSPDGHVSD